MRNLFVVDGAAGTGKSDLLAYIAQQHTTQYARIVRKFTTREQRPWEDTPLDLIVVPKEAFAPYRDTTQYYRYQYGEGEYAISKDELRFCVQEAVNTFVIVRSRETIHVLKADYAQVARVVPVFIYSDKAYILRRMRAKERALRKSGKEEVAALFHSHIRSRLRRSAALWNDYLREPLLYEHVLINNFRKKDFESLVETLFDRYAT